MLIFPAKLQSNPAEGDDRVYSRSSFFTCPAVPKPWQSSLIGSSNGGWAYVSGHTKEFAIGAGPVSEIDKILPVFLKQRAVVF